MIKDYLAWLFKPTALLVPAQGKAHGPTVVRVPGWETLQLVSDCETLEQVNRATGHAFFGGSGNEFLTPLFGFQSVFTLDGDRHRLARRLIAGSLSQRRFANMMPQLDKIIASELEGVARQKGAINVGRLARRMAMKMTCLAVLGESEPDVAARLLPAFEGVTGFLANIVSYRKSFYARAPFPLNHMIAGRVATARDHIDALIGQQRSSGFEGQSVIQTLLRAQQEEEFDDIFIRDNLISIISAGYDTTGSALSWTLFWLSQDAAFADLRKRSADIGDAEAISQFVSEVLRYCPPLEILPRRPDEKVARDPGVTMVCPCPFQAHHNPATFDRPDEFRPSRFAERKYLPTEYFPFGAASRLCLGINIATPFLHMVVRQLLERNQYFRFRNRRFSPVRRNVSLWPNVRMKADFIPAD